jgi:flagellar motility protein MotE (MotC chaperone)
MIRWFSRKKIPRNLAAVWVLSLWVGYAFPVLAQDQSAPKSASTAGNRDPGTKAAVAENPAPDQTISATLSSLEAKRLEIEKEQQQLNAQKAQLEALKRELDAKIDTLAKLQKQIEADLQKRDKLKAQAQNQRSVEEEAKLKQLVKIYTSMKPKTAAALINKLDLDVVLKLFARMKGAQVASILSYADRDRAALISERLAQLPPSK